MRTNLVSLLVVLSIGATLWGSESDDRHPVYVGARSCATCHQGKGFGHQNSQWLLSKHARAYAVLAQPEARKIAELSGISQEPQECVLCLGCHATGAHVEEWEKEDTFYIEDGVQCEKCHGAGSDYAIEAVMRDPQASQKAGLKQVTKESCLACHENAHNKPFDFEEAIAKIVHPTESVQAAKTPKYKTPLNMALHPGGKEIYVACEASDTVIVIDAQALRKVAEIPVGGQPADVIFMPDGSRAFVSNRLDDTVSVIDVSSRSVVATLAVGDVYLAKRESSQWHFYSRKDLEIPPDNMISGDRMTCLSTED